MYVDTWDRSTTGHGLLGETGHRKLTTRAYPTLLLGRCRACKKVTLEADEGLKTEWGAPQAGSSPRPMAKRGELQLVSQGESP